MTEKEKKTLAVSDSSAHLLRTDGFCRYVPKPSNIDIGDTVIVINKLFHYPYEARFVQLGSTLYLIGENSNE
jgi:hypothetical protein